MNFSYKHAITYLWARDIAKTEKFYTKILGFRKAFESEGWIELAIPGVNKCLSCNQ